MTATLRMPPDLADKLGVLSVAETDEAARRRFGAPRGLTVDVGNKARFPRIWPIDPGALDYVTKGAKR